MQLAIFSGRRRLSQRGDTIVEVLMAIIVLSTILAGAYGVASRSTKENIQTQEHAQALQVAQAQLEVLKSNPQPAALAFCFNSDNQVVTDFSQAWIADYAADNLSTPHYPADCAQSILGGKCLADDICYYIAIRRNDDTYNVTVRWDGITGGHDQVSLAYRLPK